MGHAAGNERTVAKREQAAQLRDSVIDAARAQRIPQHSLIAGHDRSIDRGLERLDHWRAVNVRTAEKHTLRARCADDLLTRDPLPIGGRHAEVLLAAGEPKCPPADDAQTSLR